ncbi:MAG: hypothetical protein JXX29_09900, partial [Deltaproteobacteria bacterium]|nr:hypothetical protein [Deltaproteobacteria bacterium]
MDEGCGPSVSANTSRYQTSSSCCVQKAIRQKIRAWKLTKWVPSSLEEIAKMINPVVRGWLNYYGKFTPSSMRELKQYLNLKPAAWAMRKFKSKHRKLTQTMRWL